MLAASSNGSGDRMPPVPPDALISAPVLPLAQYLRRLIWWAMLPLLLLAVVLGAIRLSHLRSDQAEEAERLAQRLAREVDDVLGDRVKALTLLATSPLLPAGRLEDFHRRAQAFRQQFGSELLMADDQGRMLLHTGIPHGTELPALPRPQGRAAVPLALSTGQPAVGDVFFGPIAKKWLVAIAVPVPAEGPRDRALLTLIDAKLVEERFRHAAVPEGWTVTLRDSRGEPIAGVAPSVAAASAGPASKPAPPAPAAAAWRATPALAPWSVSVGPPVALRLRGRAREAGEQLGAARHAGAAAARLGCCRACDRGPG